MTRGGALLALEVPVPRLGTAAQVRVLLVLGRMAQPRLRALFELLDAEERGRAWRIRSDQRRVNFITGHGWRRRMLSALVPAVRPEDWRFRTGPWGRPSPLQDAGCDASLSYSGELTAIAVSRGCRIGIDVELVDPLGMADTASARLSRLLEAGWVTHAPDGVGRWTDLEAAAKCTGVGLDDGTVGLGPARAPPTIEAPAPRGRDVLLRHALELELAGRRVHLALAGVPLPAAATPPLRRMAAAVGRARRGLDGNGGAGEAADPSPMPCSRVSVIPMAAARASAAWGTTP